MFKNRDGFGLVAAVVVALVSGPALADPVNLVSNGDFSQTTMPNGPSQIYSGSNASEAQLESTSNLTGWGTTGYNFIYNSASAASVANATNTYGSQSLQYGTTSLWAPGSASNSQGNGVNGFVNPPNGGNFIGADGAYEVGAITQTLTGLKIGDNYMVSFQWAAAQQQGFNGATTEGWTVGLGSQKFSTIQYQNANHGFSGWMSQTYTFTATAVSEALSFLASGSPAGEPPFSLLSGVTAYDTSGGPAAGVPEPASLAFVGLGIGLLVVYRRRQAGLARRA